MYWLQHYCLFGGHWSCLWHSCSRALIRIKCACSTSQPFVKAKALPQLTGQLGLSSVAREPLRTHGAINWEHWARQRRCKRHASLLQRQRCYLQNQQAREKSMHAQTHQSCCAGKTLLTFVRQLTKLRLHHGSCKHLHLVLHVALHSGDQSFDKAAL